MTDFRAIHSASTRPESDTRANAQVVRRPNDSLFMIAPGQDDHSSANSKLEIARLAGVIETPGEHSGCSLVFQLHTEDDGVLSLTYSTLMEALRMAQDKSVIAPLSEHWWARTGRSHGCAVQD